jgi:ArsR family transcriptional regulator
VSLWRAGHLGAKLALAPVTAQGPCGGLLCVTLAAHHHTEVRDTYGHLHLGFRPLQPRRYAHAARLEVLELPSAGRERRPPNFEALALLAVRPARRKAD